MKTIAHLIQDLKSVEIIGNSQLAIETLITDSRKAGKGALFIALKGTQVDGHQFLNQVITNGVEAVVVEELPTELLPSVTYIRVPNTAEALGWISNAMYDYPSKQLKLVGVTGTNGKTSVASFLFQLFRQLGHRCGLISTVQNQIEDEVIPATHTTPDAPNLNALLFEMKKKGCSYVFMEVSSHSVVQHRITGLTFTGGLFTNITHDHLDFHKTFDNYIAAKKGFFDALPKGAFALINADDKRGMVMVQNTKAAIKTYSLRSLADFKAKVISATLQGMQVEVNNHEMWFRLIGKFNVYNLLAVYGAAILLGEDEEEVLTAVSNLLPPPGRFELIYSTDQTITGIVDYAHTPDALENVLTTIAELRTQNEKVITVVGCGGNRDTTKRPKMAAIACKYSDIVILTSDNPRNEEPAAILEEMRVGVPPIDFKKVKVIEERKSAIQLAVEIATDGDIILVAGKGHETYQEIKGVRHHFDDREELRAAFDNV